MHVLVHEVQDSEPESSEGWQGEQRREVLQEDLRRHTQGAMILTPAACNAGSEKIKARWCCGGTDVLRGSV